MDTQLIEFSIVVTARAHNPTILNPDFLERYGIVPRSWGWEKVGEPISTIPVSTVSYDSNVNITVELNKLAVKKNFVEQPEGLPSLEDSNVAEIVRGYIKKLPHVHYLAVGINFKSFVGIENPNDFLIKKFVKEDAVSGENQLKGVNLTLFYPLEGGKVALSLMVATIKDKKGVFVDANFHRDCTEDHPDKQVDQHIENMQTDWSYNQKVLSNIFGG